MDDNRRCLRWLDVNPFVQSGTLARGLRGRYFGINRRPCNPLTLLQASDVMMAVHRAILVGFFREVCLDRPTTLFFVDFDRSGMLQWTAASGRTECVSPCGLV